MNNIPKQRTNTHTWSKTTQQNDMATRCPRACAAVHLDAAFKNCMVQDKQPATYNSLCKTLNHKDRAYATYLGIASSFLQFVLPYQPAHPAGLPLAHRLTAAAGATRTFSRRRGCWGDPLLSAALLYLPAPERVPILPAKT